MRSVSYFMRSVMRPVSYSMNCQQVFADSHQGVWLASYPGLYERPGYEARGVAGWAQE